MKDHVNHDTDLGNGWEAWELLDCIRVHGLEHAITEFDLCSLDEIPKLHNALISLTQAVNHFNNTLDELGFNEIPMEDF